MAYHCLPIELYTSILDRCTFFIPALIIFRSNSNLVIGIVCQLLLFFFLSLIIILILKLLPLPWLRSIHWAVLWKRYLYVVEENVLVLPSEESAWWMSNRPSRLIQRMLFHCPWV